MSLTKSQIISRAADYIAAPQGRYCFEWCDPGSCTVSILGRIAMGNPRMARRSVARKLAARVEARMWAEGKWDDKKFSPSWNEMVTFEYFSCEAPNYMSVCLIEHGFTFDDLYDAEWLADDDVRSEARLRFNSRHATRSNVIKYLRAWAAMEAAKEKSLSAARAQTPTLAQLAGIA